MSAHDALQVGGRGTRLQGERLGDGEEGEDIIGPDTVNTMPEATIEAFEDHGRLAGTIDVSVEGVRGTLEELAEVGVDLTDVSRALEDEGVTAFAKSFHELLGALERKAAELGLPMSGWGSAGTRRMPGVQ